MRRGWGTADPKENPDVPTSPAVPLLLQEPCRGVIPWFMSLGLQGVTGMGTPGLEMPLLRGSRPLSMRGGLTWPLPCEQRQPGAAPGWSRPAGGLPSPDSGTPWLRLRHRPREQRVRAAPASAAPSIPSRPATTRAPTPGSGLSLAPESRRIGNPGRKPPEKALHPQCPLGGCAVSLSPRPPRRSESRRNTWNRVQVIASLWANYCN